MREKTTSAATPMRCRKELAATLTRTRNSPRTPVTFELATERGLHNFSRRGPRVRAKSSIAVHAATASPLSLLEQTLWTEIEQLNAATNRLRERILEVKREFSADAIAAVTGGEPLPVEARTGGLFRNPPKQRGQNSKDEPPYAVTFTPSHSQKKAANVRLQFTSPRKTPMKENDSSVLTSLAMFEYTPQNDDHREGARPTENRNVLQELKRDETFETGTPVHLSEAATMGGPFVVDLQKSDHGAANNTAEKPTELSTSVDSARESAKHLLLQANMMGVEQDLNHYMSDLLAIQRDTLDAQKRGLIDPNDSSVRELRLGIRDELNACRARILTLESLQTSLSAGVATKKTIS
ncbi:hypothetical protein ECC02_000583 [Trypanosoma cruzi]|uniref:Uncharacterized protein n=2 Tax=Trypanosoma cruzi TaxID=5693 RepID=Q4DZN1_TRYCC|nr:hypothetical protein Tc00.1047053504147.140 [Trypanosoma cruzi]EAN97985.1 hypothetical protein Tc00.1047053504147.140 [Trypanosoma cruzi]KAF5226458.1 hypothetical protein ECC02_000583 [Trypanosoma cruzi]|eukprot:XP_819836.1 hypothetical protein [Trypanosoma cruzi strain CL Brener]